MRPTCSSGPCRPGSAGLRQWPGSFGALPCHRLRGGCFFRFLGLVRVRGQRQRHAAVGREVLLEVGELLLRRAAGDELQARLFLRRAAQRRLGRWGWRGLAVSRGGRGATGSACVRRSDGAAAASGPPAVLGLAGPRAAGTRCIAAGRRFGWPPLAGAGACGRGCPCWGRGVRGWAGAAWLRAGLAGSLFSRRLLAAAATPPLPEPRRRRRRCGAAGFWVGFSIVFSILIISRLHDIRCSSVFLRVTHAKGLAGQHTAQHHTFKQVCLGKVRQQDGGGFLPGAGGKRHGRGGAVDVVHAGLGVAGQEVVQEGFNTAHRQGCRGILQGHQQLTVLVGNGKALLRRSSLVALSLVPLIDGLVQLMGRYTEHHTVDRLDLDGRAMYIGRPRPGTSGRGDLAAVRGSWPFFSSSQ